MGPEPPSVLADRYVIERELGRGGAATVYLAHDRRYDRPVAVKVLEPELSHAIGAQRFLQEILVTARLHHPHIVSVLDSGDADGLLYYVTPYLEGESLRSRLERERQLPLEDALFVTREVGDALAYAHGRGLVHRDIKPENILFSSGHAFVADFGIVHAIVRAADDRLTSTGLVLGTPAYMSPEQAAGERGLDGRSDLYSLACVLYEMVAGLPPFTGPTAQSVISQRFTHAPQPLRAYRPSVPPHVESAVSRALAMSPADRFSTVREFVAALGVPLGATPQSVTPTHIATDLGMPGGGGGRTSGRRWLVAALGVAAAAAAMVLGRGAARAGLRLGDPEPDSGRYVILRLAGPDGRVLTADRARRWLNAEFRRWRDLQLVDPEIAEQEAGTPASLDASRAAALRLGAGRLILVRLSPAGDSVELDATLYNARGVALREQSVRLPDAAGANDAYRRLSTALLRAADPLPDADEGDRGTDRLAAWHAYERGQAACGRWDLARAEAEFRAAVAADPRYAQAQVWLAQVVAWQRPDRPADWREPAGRAAALVDRLTRRDSLLARGLHALATEQYPDACAAYGALRALAPASDLPWYGLGHCQGMDPAVVRDARSPSGWRFRGSYHGAALAYDSAIQRADGAPAFAFRQLDRFLIMETLRFRSGRALPPDTLTFAAYPALQADTLAYIPYPAAEVAAGAFRTLPPTLDRALRRNADWLAERFGEWVRRSPESADARELLARVQEEQGARDPEGGGLLALRTLREAQRLSTDPYQRLVLAARMVRVLVKDEQFGAARRLADSLLDAVPRADARQAEYLAGLAALTGKVERTARLLRTIALTEPSDPSAARVPDAVAEAVAAYTAQAALGVCSDSLRRMGEAVSRLLQRYADPAAHEQIRRTVLERPLSLAVPCLGPSAVVALGESRDRLVRMQQAFAAGRFAVVRAHFDTLRLTRRADRPGDISLDHTYQEAWLLAAMGDTAAAVRYLDLPLTALTTLSTLMLRNVAPAAAVGRAMALRAELGAAVGDVEGARRWAAAVTELWAAADPPLRQVVSRVRRRAGLPDLPGTV